MPHPDVFWTDDGLALLAPFAVDQAPGTRRRHHITNTGHPKCCDGELSPPSRIAEPSLSEALCLLARDVMGGAEGFAGGEMTPKCVRHTRLSAILAPPYLIPFSVQSPPPLPRKCCTVGQTCPLDFGTR